MPEQECETEHHHENQNDEEQKGPAELQDGPRRPSANWSQGPFRHRQDRDRRQATRQQEHRSADCGEGAGRGRGRSPCGGASSRASLPSSFASVSGGDSSLSSQRSRGVPARPISGHGSIQRTTSAMLGCRELGKALSMAMLIAWQTINKVATPNAPAPVGCQNSAPARRNHPFAGRDVNFGTPQGLSAPAGRGDP